MIEVSEEVLRIATPTTAVIHAYLYKEYKEKAIPVNGKYYARMNIRDVARRLGYKYSGLGMQVDKMKKLGLLESWHVPGQRETWYWVKECKE